MIGINPIIKNANGIKISLIYTFIGILAIITVEMAIKSITNKCIAMLLDTIATPIVSIENKVFSTG
jgi:hypothetical protein